MEKNKLIKPEITHGCGLHCIKMNNLSVKIGGDEILNDVNLHVHCGSLTAVIGRNGAGKSTLLKAILGEVPYEGEIRFTDLADGKTKNLSVGYVPQSLHIEKNSPVSVYDLIAGYVTKVPVFLRKSKPVYEKIVEHLKVFHVEDLIDKCVCDLSGGELQRVLLSLATMPVPKLLVLDEPASGIDQSGMKLFYETLDSIKDKYDLAIIMVSHDLEYVREYADKVVLLDKTVLVQGTAKAVYESEEFDRVFGVKKYE